MTLDEIMQAAQQGRFDDLPIVLDIPVAGKLAGMERGPAYAAAKNGFMPTVKVGKKRDKVPTRRWINKLLGEAA